MENKNQIIDIKKIEMGGDDELILKQKSSVSANSQNVKVSMQ